jgi:hypothetical protein
MKGGSDENRRGSRWVAVIRRGHIEQAAPLPGTVWELPFILWVWDGFVDRPVGRYRTRQGARAAAKRRGIVLPRRDR